MIARQLSGPDLADDRSMMGFPGAWLDDLDSRPLSAIPTSPARAPVMPEVSRFFGIAIAMYFQDRSTPRFRALSGAYAADVDIESGAVDGHFPPRALGLVQEWRERHLAELRDNWRRASVGLPLVGVPPLE